MTKLILMISAYQKTIISSDPTFLFNQLQSHLPQSDEKAEMPPIVRIGHLFMGLLFWLDNQASITSNTPPGSVLLIHPGLGYSVDKPVFSMLTLKLINGYPKVITRELTHNITLENFKTTHPDQLIFFTNTMITPTGDLLSMHHSTSDWWIINNQEIMSLDSRPQQLA